MPRVRQNAQVCSCSIRKRCQPVPDHSSDPLISIGFIRKPHGIRGELSLALNAEDPDLVQGEVFLVPPGKSTQAAQDKAPNSSPVSPAAKKAGKAAPVSLAQKYTVERARFHHGSLIVSFKEVRSRNDAELLRQYSVLVPKSRLAPLEADEVYLLDLHGLTVLAVNQENNEETKIGIISSVDIPSGQELWTIVTPGGKEILFPAVNEFVLDIDLAQNTARIAPPPGLLELYLE